MFCSAVGIKEVKVTITRAQHEILVAESITFCSNSLLTTIFAGVWHDLFVNREICVEETELLQSFENLSLVSKLSLSSKCIYCLISSKSFFIFFSSLYL